MNKCLRLSLKIFNNKRKYNQIIKQILNKELYLIKHRIIIYKLNIIKINLQKLIIFNKMKNLQIFKFNSLNKIVIIIKLR